MVREQKEFSSDPKANHTLYLVHKQKMTLLHGLLKDTVRRLPIIRPGKIPSLSSFTIHDIDFGIIASQTTTAPLPYTCATSTHAYFSWSVGRRKALEVSSPKEEMGYNIDTHGYCFSVASSPFDADTSTATSI